MSFLDKARQKAEQARQAASTGITQATSPEAKEQLRQSGVQLRQGGVQVRQAAGKAGRGLVTAIEKIDPALLGDIIIKATALQEKVNLSLRDKKAAYRIGEITITATIPPQLGFTIERIGDPENELADSRHLVGKVATAESEVVSLEAEPAAEDDPVPGSGGYGRPVARRTRGLDRRRPRGVARGLRPPQGRRPQLLTLATELHLFSIT